MASRAYRTWKAEAITTTGFACPSFLTIELITKVTFNRASPIIENLNVCNFISPFRKVGLNSRPLIKSTIRFPVFPFEFTLDFFPGQNRARFLAIRAITAEKMSDDAIISKYLSATMLKYKLCVY